MKVLLAKKIGMTRMFDESGNNITVTVLDVSQNVISKVIKTGDKVTHFEVGKNKRKNAIKPEIGNYATLGFVPMFRKIFKSEDLKEVGTELKADVFSIGDKVDVIAVNKGKGFQGVVKRWGFKGGPKTHGQSDRQRAPGSIGERMTPGRVFKGQRMGGHMGNVQQTIKNLKIANVVVSENIIAVSGSVPGTTGSLVIIKESRN